MLSFNNYRTSQMIEDMMQSLNQDFAKLSRASVETVTVLPAASASEKGQLIYLEKAAGTADQLYVCKKLANNTFSWVLIN